MGGSNSYTSTSTIVISICAIASVLYVRGCVLVGVAGVCYYKHAYRFSVQFHRECIDKWLTSNHNTCPIDDQPVYNPTHQRQHTATGKPLLLKTPQRRKSTARNRQVAPLSHAVHQFRLEKEARGLGQEATAKFSISGRSITGTKMVATSVEQRQEAVSKKSTDKKKLPGLK